MKRKIVNFLLSFSLLSSSFLGIITYSGEQVEAATKVTYEVTTKLNVRAGAGSNYKLLGTLKKGTKITVSSQTKNGWYKFNYKGKEAYVSGKYVKKITTKTTSTKSTTASNTGNRYKVTVNNLNLRKGAGTKYKSVATVPKNITVTLLSKKGNWAYVQAGNYKGWVSNKYLKKTTETYKSVGLVEITEKNGFVIDQRYKTKNNFMGYQIYPSNAKVLLRSNTAKKLQNANQLAQKYGYKIKIWDAYRPLSYQWAMYKKVNNSKYVSPPSNKSNHSKGVAVDITLVDSNNKELEMPTKFDDFTNKASINYKGNSKTAQKNMELLISIMRKSGFTTITSEWWHYNDSDASKYAVLDVPMN